MLRTAHVWTLPLLLVALAAEDSHAAAAARERPQIEYRLGRIRIFYATDGLHAVDPTDVDHSGRPDQVEDIAKQTWAAYALFVETLGFPDPFTSERFSSAAFLDVHLLDKSVLKSNGVAYDELQRFRRPSDPEGTQVLCFNVATSIKAPANLTPAHEFFHIIQYGATYFKNAWYSEGTARWSERALGAGALGQVRYTGPWPPSETHLSQVFQSSYAAALDFWNPLAAIDDPQGDLPADRIRPELKRLTYSTGAPVLQDGRLQGWAFIRDLLVELGKVDDVAYRELGYTRWSEANQNAKENNPYIYQAVLRTARHRAHQFAQ